MLPSRTRLLSSLVGLSATAALIAGCGSEEQAAPENPAPSNAPAAVETSGTYEPFKEGASAITYDPAQVPAGATAKFAATSETDKTKLSVDLNGFQPNRAYGAHVHTKPCGATGEAAGPHYQEKADPVKPSVDPAFANPQNEVWLDFHTDQTGKATATADGAWKFQGRADAKSFVIHETHTHSEPGKAGTAGGRLACLNVKF